MKKRKDPPGYPGDDRITQRYNEVKENRQRGARTSQTVRLRSGLCRSYRNCYSSEESGSPGARAVALTVIRQVLFDFFDADLLVVHPGHQPAGDVAPDRDAGDEVEGSKEVRLR
jgi:hypothetical protein